LPKDEPLAPNPPYGAMIDYYLRKNTTAPITLEITDEHGKLVHRYSSDDKLPSINTGEIVVTPDWFPKPQSLSRAPGMHRIVWDLHFPYPDALRYEESKDGTEPAGIWVLPGTYIVKLTVEDRTYTKALLVKNDPRVKISQSDLIKQYDFAQRIQSERLRLAKAIREVRNLLKQAEAAHDSQKKISQKLDDQIVAFENAVTGLTEIRAKQIQYGLPGSFPTKLDSLYYLSSEFADLQHVVDDSDAVPSPDALSGFNKQRVALNNALQRWEQFKAESLTPLNTALQQEGLAPLKP
jgi:hypothetical protein